MVEDANRFDVQGIAASILSPLQKQVVRLIERPWVDIQQDIERLAQSIQAENANLVVDKPSKFHLVRTSLLLAAYRVLSALISDQSLLLTSLQNALNDRVEQSVEAYLMERFGISPGASPEEAFSKASINFKKIGDQKFGRTFLYEQEVLDERQSVIVVRKCFFHDFFRANGALELLLLFCAGDDL